MISVIKNTKTESLEKPFPKMMRSTDGLLVFFTEPKKGFVIKDNERSEYGFGHMASCWHPLSFTDFEGVVELRNDWVESI
tara:strand:- start:290 stop:529 length:240 start_codon:yes stop_codon:yes gene_type:complete